MLLRKTVEEALSLYNCIKDLPDTTTKGVFKEKTGFTLLGTHPTMGESFLMAITNLGAPMIFKLLPDFGSSVQSNEINYGCILNGGPCLVPVTFAETASKDHPLCGLLMPKYDRSLLQDEGIIYDSGVLLLQGTRIKEALEYMHKMGIVHMDVKEGNIFIDHLGSWWLGDFGSCVEINGEIRSTSTFCYPENLLAKKTLARPMYDFYMLCTVLVNRLSKDLMDWENLDHSVRKIVLECGDPKLKSFMETLLKLHDDEK